MKNWDVIPSDTYTNIDRASINCGMFSEHIKATNSQDFNDRLPDHTIVIKVSGLKPKESDSNKDMPDFQKYCLLTGCSDNDVMEGSSNKSTKRIDPLSCSKCMCCVGRPIMIKTEVFVLKRVKSKWKHVHIQMCETQKWVSGL